MCVRERERKRESEKERASKNLCTSVAIKSCDHDKRDLRGMEIFCKRGIFGNDNKDLLRFRNRGG